jgi:hypothetical protein
MNKDLMEYFGNGTRALRKKSGEELTSGIDFTAESLKVSEQDLKEKS